MILLIKLILAHFIGDFLLQPTSWLKEKETSKLKSYNFYIHIIIHGLLVLLLLWNVEAWRIAIVVVILHGIIDIVKLYAQKENTRANWFLIDQSLHIISILVIWYLFFKPDINISEWLAKSNIWIYALAIFFITSVSAIVMREVMSKWSNDLKDIEDKESLKNAGKYIGILERLFVFIFVISGNWEGIGFLLAAKSVFRFGDLKESNDRKLTEYILIGTLLSIGIAMAIGMGVLKLIEN